MQVGSVDNMPHSLDIKLRPHVSIATPSYLAMRFERDTDDFLPVGFLILDEADCWLDPTCVSDLMFILNG